MLNLSAKALIIVDILAVDIISHLELGCRPMR
jgi:hypothetical protein